MAKIYRVIQTTLNQLKKMSIRSSSRLTNKVYLSDITVTNIYQSFTYKMAVKIDMQQNYVTVTLCMAKQSPAETRSRRSRLTKEGMGVNATGRGGRRSSAEDARESRRRRRQGGGSGEGLCPFPKNL